MDQTLFPFPKRWYFFLSTLSGNSGNSIFQVNTGLSPSVVEFSIHSCLFEIDFRVLSPLTTKSRLNQGLASKMVPFAFFIFSEKTKKVSMRGNSFFSKKRHFSYINCPQEFV